MLDKNRFRKQDKVNVYRILGVNGIQSLSVPLESHRNNLLYKDVRIAYHEPWVSKHLQSIRSAYGNSAFFEHYFGDISYLLEKKFVYIIDLNMATLEYICNKIKIKDLSFVFGDNDLNSSDWTNDNRVRIYPEYHQVWEGKQPFAPNLSAIDLLFCHGPESKSYLPYFLS